MSGRATRMKKDYWLLIIVIATIVPACDLSGLGGSGEITQPNQINILYIKVSPDTVAVGDTATFTCVFIDSIKTNLKFYWHIHNGTAIGGKDTTYAGNMVYMTLQNHIRWKAPSKSGTYDFEVEEDNGSRDSSGVSKVFGVPVK
jgi:hypothetical protein